MSKLPKVKKCIKCGTIGKVGCIKNDAGGEQEKMSYSIQSCDCFGNVLSATDDKSQCIEDWNGINTKLKPCPDCGNKNIEINHTKYNSIICSNCGAGHNIDFLHSEYSTINKSVKKWESLEQRVNVKDLNNELKSLKSRNVEDKSFELNFNSNQTFIKFLITIFEYLNIKGSFIATSLTFVDGIFGLLYSDFIDGSYIDSDEWVEWIDCDNIDESRIKNPHMEFKIKDGGFFKSRKILGRKKPFKHIVKTYWVGHTSYTTHTLINESGTTIDLYKNETRIHEIDYIPFFRKILCRIKDQQKSQNDNLEKSQLAVNNLKKLIDMVGKLDA